MTLLIAHSLSRMPMLCMDAALDGFLAYGDVIETIDSTCTRSSSDEVGLVDYSSGLPAADTDEDAFVQPLQIGGGGLDLG